MFKHFPKLLSNKTRRRVLADRILEITTGPEYSIDTVKAAKAVAAIMGIDVGQESDSPRGGE
jgi:hypothetical protein